MSHTLTRIATAHPHAAGVVELPTVHLPPTVIGVALQGLQPDSQYVLSLNAAEPDSRTGQVLGGLTLAGWPTGHLYHSPGGGEVGFWNFATVHTDAEGSVRETLQLPVPPGGYKVRIFVKTAEHYGNVHILQSEPLFLEIAASPIALWRWPEGGTPFLLALGGTILWMAYRRRPERRARRQQQAPGPLDDTLIERARAEGTFRHSPTYHWVEIHGRRKTFRPRQALVLQILCEQDPNGYGLPQHEIIRIWEKTFSTKRADPLRVRDIFRAYPDEPGDFVVRLPGPASVYRLGLETDPCGLGHDDASEASEASPEIRSSVTEPSGTLAALLARPAELLPALFQSR